jgi:sodium-dependent dicarboxylate transporter 2/3/5
MKWLLAVFIQTALITLILTSQISESVQHGLIILSLIAHAWLAELLPLSVTALLVPVLAVAFNVMDLKVALLSFAHPIIFLFLGGFALALPYMNTNLINTSRMSSCSKPKTTV